MLWGLFIVWVITLLAGCTGANSVNVLPSRLEVSYGMGDMGTDFTTANPISASSEAEWVGLTLGWDLFVPTVRVLPEPIHRGELRLADNGPTIIEPEATIEERIAKFLPTVDRYWLAFVLVVAALVLLGFGTRRFTRSRKG
jgi:hypothetical protein